MSTPANSSNNVRSIRREHNAFQSRRNHEKARESMADMQERHEKTTSDQAKAAEELSLKAIQAASASNAKIAV